MRQRYHSQGNNERINDPDRPTTLTEVVEELRREELYEAQQLKEARRVRIVVDPKEAECPKSPTGAHYWKYTSPRRRVCIHCPAR